MPGVAALRNSVQELIKGHAGDTDVRKIPQAAALLASAAAASDAEGLLSYLRDWAIAPMLQVSTKIGPM